MEKTIDELRAEADELGIVYNKNIGADKLALKIEEHYTALESGTPAPTVKVVATESEVKGAKGYRPIGVRAKEAKEAALVTHIVVITDNDQRENNLTQVVSVNCSNDYFDLGTVRVPLNTPVELAQGFINVLNEIKIPMHTRDQRTGLGKTVVRNRYSIAYQDELRSE
jgi:hypothetical protein